MMMDLRPLFRNWPPPHSARAVTQRTFAIGWPGAKSGRLGLVGLQQCAQNLLGALRINWRNQVEAFLAFQSAFFVSNKSQIQQPSQHRKEAFRRRPDWSRKTALHERNLSQLAKPNTPNANVNSDTWQRLMVSNGEGRINEWPSMGPTTKALLNARSRVRKVRWKRKEEKARCENICVCVYALRLARERAQIVGPICAATVLLCAHKLLACSL